MAKKTKKTTSKKTPTPKKAVVKKVKKVKVDEKPVDILAAEEQKKVEKVVTQNHIIIKKVKADSKEALASNWFVIHTYSGHEHRVANTLMQRIKTMKLTDKILELLIPTQDKILIKRGKKSTIKEKIFPGYMLIRMILNDDSWLAVRTTPGVTSFVGIGNKPTPLPAKEVAAIVKFMEMEAPKYKASFTVGEAVRIVEGPFADFLGSIDSIDNAKGKVKVLVSIFGRETPVELDFLQVTKI
jgi:transcriptional antiterminator NusG